MSEAAPSAPRIEAFGVRADGQPAALVTLTGPTGIVAKVTDHGATLVSLVLPASGGDPVDVVLGFDDVAGYEAAADQYLGASIGRVANRIAQGRFTLDGRTYRLARNEPPHHLHGGAGRSFDRVVWERVGGDTREVVLRHRSPDGEGGYPGAVEVTATYRVEDDGLTITYRASVDATTPLVLTNHAYLNLAGAGTVHDHTLHVDADRVLEVGDDLIPTGVERDVTGTPFDLRGGALLGERIAALPATAGFDHHLVAASPSGVLRPLAVLAHPPSGRTLTLHSAQPGLQVYTGGQLPALVGKGGATYGPHAGMCLEPQQAPDQVNRADADQVLVSPGQDYAHVIRWAVSG
ncbi:MAG: aldose epimerase family protein [Nitriliruptoraceae bacterium]